MGYGLDTKDMERHSVELRLNLDRAKRRFELAQLADRYVAIVSAALDEAKPNNIKENNCLDLDRLSNQEDARKLSQFLEHLVDRATKPELNTMMTDVIRRILLKLRRREVMDNEGNQIEPLCYFCAREMGAPGAPAAQPPATASCNQPQLQQQQQQQQQAAPVRYEYCLQPDQIANRQASPAPTQFYPEDQQSDESPHISPSELPVPEPITRANNGGAKQSEPQESFSSQQQQQRNSSSQAELGRKAFLMGLNLSPAVKEFQQKLHQKQPAAAGSQSGSSQSQQLGGNPPLPKLLMKRTAKRRPPSQPKSFYADDEVAEEELERELERERRHKQSKRPKKERIPLHAHNAAHRTPAA